jgi:hypothetical protein
VVAPQSTGPDLCTIIAPEETQPESDEAFLQRVLTATDSAVAKARAQSYVTLRFVSDKPVGLTVSSDWHVTPKSATDLRALFAYADAVGAAEGLWALAVGDLGDNPIKHKPTDAKDVPEEFRILDLLVGRFKGRLVGMTDGNHDAWLRALVGLDHLKLLAERHHVHYAPDELIYVVEIVSPTTGETTARWVIATRHKYRRHSALNITHACWRWLEEMVNEWPTDTEGRTLLPDALCIGDNHVAAVETRHPGPRTVIGVRMGAWQHSTSFSRGLGFPGYRPTAPVLILPPTRAHNIQGFADYQEGIRALQHARG